MEIEVGKYYKTRKGLKVRIYALDGGLDYPVHGAVLRPSLGWVHCSWSEIGKSLSTNSMSEDDIVEGWEEPLDFDWDCLPTWFDKCIALDSGGDWFCYANYPSLDLFGGYWDDLKSTALHISKGFEPKNFTGDWKDSLFINPKYKDVIKV